MIFLKIAKISACFLIMLMVSSCCIFNQRGEDWPHGFPVRAEQVKYDRDPVQSYNKTNKTYTVTSEFMENAVNNKIFVDAVIIWKNENGIK